MENATNNTNVQFGPLMTLIYCIMLQECIIAYSVISKVLKKIKHADIVVESDSNFDFAVGKFTQFLSPIYSKYKFFLFFKLH